jgi:hypothetical protein
MRQLRRLIQFAPAVVMDEASRNRAKAEMLRRMVEEFVPETDVVLPARPRLLSVEMKSPLTVVIELPWESVIFMGAGLLLLAERICTFKPRVSRKRKEELLKATVLDKVTETVAAARADALAQVLLDESQESRETLFDRVQPEHVDLRVRPLHVDLIDPKADPEGDLEEWGD